MANKFVVCRVSKGKIQNRVTLPKELKADYVKVMPVKLDNVFKTRKEFFR